MTEPQFVLNAAVGGCWMTTGAVEVRAVADKEALQQKQAGHIKDARGRKVTQLDPVTMHLLRRHDIIPTETLRQMAEEIDPGESKKRQMGLIQGVLCAIAVYILLFFYFRFFGKGSWRDPVMIIFYAGYLVVPPVVIYMRFRRARTARHERIQCVMLKHLRCPHCGYEAQPNEGGSTMYRDGSCAVYLGCCDKQFYVIDPDWKKKQ